MVRTARAGFAASLFLAAFALMPSTASAVQGGYLTIGQYEQFVPADKAKVGDAAIKLSSFSFEGGGADEYGVGRVQRPDKNGVFVTPPAPDAGPGTLVIAKLVSIQAPELKSYCAKKDKKIPVVYVHIPKWDKFDSLRSQGFDHYKLSNVSVNKCAHVDRAPAEVLHLDFAQIEPVNK